MPTRTSTPPRYPFVLVLHCTTLETEALARGELPRKVRDALMLCATEVLEPNLGEKAVVIHRSGVTAGRRRR